MSWNFNPQQHDPNVGFTRQAEGDYTLVIKRTNAYTDQQNVAEGIKLSCEILESHTAEGQNAFVGKNYDWELAVLSQNPQRQEIANGDLSAVCIVAGVGAFEGQFGPDGAPVKDMFGPALHDKPFKVSITHTSKVKDDGKTSTYVNVRNIRNMAGLDAVGNQSPTWAGSAPSAAPPQGQANPTQQANPQTGGAPAGQSAGTAQASGGWGGSTGASEPQNVAPPDQQPQQGGAPGWGQQGGQATGGGSPGWGGS